MKTCRGCQYAVPLYGENPEYDDAIVICEWQPEGGLPYAWRHAESEVGSVKLDEVHDCPQYRELPFLFGDGQ